MNIVFSCSFGTEGPDKMPHGLTAPFVLMKLEMCKEPISMLAFTLHSQCLLVKFAVKRLNVYFLSACGLYIGGSVLSVKPNGVLRRAVVCVGISSRAAGCAAS